MRKNEKFVEIFKNIFYLFVQGLIVWRELINGYCNRILLLPHHGIRIVIRILFKKIHRKFGHMSEIADGKTKVIPMVSFLHNIQSPGRQ